MPNPSPYGNPFEAAVQTIFGQPRPAPQPGLDLQGRGLLDGSGISGTIFNEPTARIQMRVNERNRSATSAAEQKVLKAQQEIIGRVNELRASNPGLATHQLISTLVADPVFARNALLVPGNQLTKFVQDIMQAASPPAPGKPQVLPEGGMLVSPEGQTLATNPKPSPFAQATEGEMARRAVQRLGDVQEAGEVARMDRFALERLEELGPQIGTGTAAGLQNYLRRWGINLPTPNASNLEAYAALVDRLTPAQRQGLPGAASDRDVAIFRGAIPSLSNTVEGNQLIISTLKAMADDRIARAAIADDVYEGKLTVPEALRKMRELPNPMQRFLDTQRRDGPPRAPQAGQPQRGARADDPLRLR